MRQAWVPRAMNASLAVFLLACISPLATRLDDRSTWLAVVLVVLCLPVLLVVALCLTSAVRPGALGRAARRSRARRRAKAAGPDA